MKELFDSEKTIMSNENECLVMSRGTTEYSFLWDDIQSIVAYKRDLITTDLVLIDVASFRTSLTYTLHEEMIGFDQFCGLMEYKLKIQMKGWYAELIKPAFVEKQICLFRRCD